MKKRSFCGLIAGVTACCLLGVVAPDRAAAQYPSQNATLLSHIDVIEFGANNGNDCWGYTSPSGREYALMGLSNKVAFVEITDPTNADWFASISHDNSLWGDVKVYQDVAYAVVDVQAEVGIQVIDMSDIDNHNVTLVLTIPTPTKNHNVAIDADSGYLYTCGSSGGSDRTVIFDLTNPLDPIEVGTWGTYEHDAQIVTYTSGPYEGRQIMFGASEGRGLDIVDVTDKSATFLISRTEYPNLSYCHQLWTEDLQHLFINDETDGLQRTTVFDISSLEFPIMLGEYGSGLGATDHNQYVRDGIMFEADYHSGLRVYDVSKDPVNPTPLAFFDTYPPDDGAGFDGAWSVYPFFPSGTVIISDEAGLFVVSVDLNVLTFSYPNGLPLFATPGVATPIALHIEALGAALNTGTVALHASIDGQPETVLAMSDLGNGDFEASLPPADCFGEIDYYVSAENEEGTLFVDPAGAPANTHTTVVLTGIDVSFEDDFETAQGWTVGDAGDDATTGIWVRVDPNGTAAQPENDHTPNPGTDCFITGQGSPGGGLGENDVDGGKTTLVSPLIDLSDGDANIGYWRWYSNGTGGTPNADVFVIDISNNGGASWTNVETIGPSGPETTGGWIFHEFSVSDFVTPTAQVRMRFIASDEGEGSLVEAALDDFSVFSPVCLLGDCDGDGDVDLDEYAAMHDCMQGPDQLVGPQCDCSDMDDDGDVDMVDYHLLLGTFTGVGG